MNSITFASLLGIKRLGDSVITEMETNWSGAPPSTRLAAYAAALAGTAFLLKLQAASDNDNTVGLSHDAILTIFSLATLSIYLGLILMAHSASGPTQSFPMSDFLPLSQLV